MKQLYIVFVVLLLIIPHPDLSAQWTQSIAMEGGSIIDDVVEYKGSIYITVNYGGVYRSDDNGTTWQATAVPMQGNAGSFVIINDQLLVLYYEHTYSSSDGINFTETAGVGTFINDVATDGTTLVAGGIGGIYISDDQAATWTLVDDPETQGNIAAVAISGSVILAADKMNSGYLLKSTDMGATWEEIEVGNSVLDIAYQGTTVFMNVSYIGILRSNDDGATWQQVRQQATTGTIAVTPTHVYHIASGTYATSDNEGDSWVENLDGLPSVFSIQGVFAGTSYIFAGTWGGGIYRKPLDNSAPWGTCNAGLSFHAVRDLDIKNDEILAGGLWAFVMKSTDEGQTWTRRTDHLATLSGDAIVRLGNDIFVATGSIYHSSDGGSTWAKKGTNLPVGSATVLGAFKGKLYTQVQDEMYVSSNGESWTKRSDGITGTARTIFSDDENFYVGTYHGLFKLSSDEQQWEKIDIGIASQSIGQIAKLGKILLVAEQSNGIFKSMDDGQTWKNINNNLIQSMAVRNNEIYAGGLMGALYHSLDSGASWADIRANLPSGVVSPIDFTSKHMVVGVGYRGLWFRPIGEVAPPYLSFPSTLTDSTFLVDEPIVIHFDQPIQKLDGTPITEDNVEEIIAVTTNGTFADYTVSLDEENSEITIVINDVQDDADYQIGIAPVANAAGLEKTAKSYLMRAVSSVPPSVADISIETPKNTAYHFTSGDFTEKYTSDEDLPLEKIKVISLPANGTLKLGSSDVAVDAEISSGELSNLTYTPVADFVGSDQWEYAASDGKNYSNAAAVTVSVSPVTGIIGEDISGNMTYYPNPVETILTISNPNRHSIEWLTVTDMNGRSLPLPQEKNDEMVTVDFTGVPSGIYIMAIRSEGQLHYRKVLRR
jgi:photosystem II stability/assembly factor-like uncharacterized protein